MKALMRSAFDPIDTQSVQTVYAPVIRPDQVLVDVAAAWGDELPDLLTLVNIQDNKKRNR